MSDVNANINISIDSSQALSQLRALQNQISAFNQSVIAGNVAAAQAQKDLNRNLTAQINASRGFTTSIANVETSVSRLGTAIDKNRLSLGEYFRYGVASSKTFGKSMREHAQIMELAADRVKRLQTQYVALGQAAGGYQRALAIRPTELFNAGTAISIQRQQIFNKLLHDGSTALVNWGKNTQWAGRQLMVGFTVPLTIFGGVAGKIFMDLEKQIIQFKRVYGDLGTPMSERNAMVEEIKALSKEFTKYGISVSDTVGLAAKAAATGAQGKDLIAATTEATRLATLGQIDYQQALDATISLQTAFRISSDELADQTNFLNAVENQTVTSLDDITQAIPTVAPVIKGLGGDVQDLAIFMTAMREGGVQASEGANALKSGLASLINPTKAAREQLEKVGINIDAIIKGNKGDVRGLVMEFGKALSTLGKFERQQTLAKMFGKYQFARLGALFDNISKKGSQASRVIDLTALSAKELGQIAEGELGQLEEAVSVKFTASIEKLKLAIAPIGEAFLKIATPIVEFITKVAEKFNELPDGAKTFITWGVAIAGVLIPSVIMLVGLLGNFAGNMLKIGAAFARVMGKSSGLSNAFEYLSNEQLDAMAAAASLEGQTNSLTSAINVQRSAVAALAGAYGRYTAAAGAAAANLPQAFRRAPAPRGYATGGFVAGTGNEDSEPAMLMPGEFVVNKKAATQYGALLSAMNAGTLRGYALGSDPTVKAHLTTGVGLSAAQGLALPGLPERLNHTLTILQRIEDVLGSGVYNLQKVSNLVAELPATFNDQLRRGMSQSEFASQWSDAGTDKWRVTAAVAGEDFDALLPHLRILDEKILRATAGMDSIDDPILAEKVRQAFTELPAESQVALRSIRGLADQFDTLRLSIADLTQEQMAELRRNGIDVSAFGEGSSRRIRASVPGVPERSFRPSQESHDINRRTYRNTDAIFNTPSQSAMAAATAAATAAGEQGGLAYWTAFAQSLRSSGKSARQIVAASVAAGIDPGMLEAAIAPAFRRTRVVEEAIRELGLRAGGALPQAVLDGAGAASPPAWSRQLGVWIGQGIEQGMVGELADVRAKLDAAVMSGGGVGPSSPIGGRPRPQGRGNKFAGLVSRGAVPSTNYPDGLPQSKRAAEGLRDTESGLRRFNGKIMGGMMALDGLVMAMSFAEGGIGEFAQKIMPAVFGIQGLSMALPLLSNPITATAAAIAAVGGAMWLVKKSADDVKQKSNDLAKAMFGSTESINGMAAFFGKKTAVQRLAELQANKAAGTELGPQALTRGQEYVASDAGQKLIEEIKMVRDTLGSAEAGKALANQLEAAVLSGAIGPKMAHSISAAVGGALEDAVISADASAKIRSVMVIGQKITAKDRLKIMADIFADATSVERAMADAGLVWDGSSWLAQVSMIATGAGTPDLAAENLSGALIAGQETLNQMLAKNKLDLESDTISAEVFLNRQKEILETAKQQGLTWEGVKKKFQDAYPDEMDDVDSIAQPIIDSMFSRVGEGLGTTLKNSLENVNTGRLVTNMFNPQNMRDHIRILQEDLATANRGQARILRRDISNLQDMETATMRISIAVSSGQLSKDALEKLFNGKTDEEIEELWLKIGAMEDDDSKMFLDLLNASGGDPIVTSMAIRLLENGDKKKLDKLLLETTKGEAYGVEVGFVLDQSRGGLKDLEQINDKIEEFRNIPQPLTRGAAVKFFSDGFDLTKSQVNQFMALPDVQQKAFITRFITLYETRGKALGAEAARYQNQGPGAPINPEDAGSRIVFDYTMFEGGFDNSSGGGDDGMDDPRGGSDGSGSGGSGEDPLAGYKEMWKGFNDKLKMYTNIEKIVKKYKKSKNALERALKDPAMAFTGGLATQMKNAGLSDMFINDLLSKGYDEAKKMFDILKKRNKLAVANRAFLLSTASEQVFNNRQEKRKKRFSSDDENSGASKIMKEFGVSKEVMDKILSDDTALMTLMGLWQQFEKGVKGSRVQLDRFVKSFIGLEDEVENTTVDDAISLIDQAWDKLEEKTRKPFEQAIEKLEESVKLEEDAIDAAQRLIDVKQEEIDDLEHLNDLDKNKIDDYNRQIEMEERKVEALQREDAIRQRVADGLQHELDVMSRTEQAIRDAYQKRIDALEQVARMNDRILQSQQDQLNIGKAISEGDVYAAAQAAAEMQRNSVQFAADQNRAGLEQGMENQVNGLTTASGMTRAQAEAQIQAIQDQSYQTSLAIRDIEDAIYKIKQEKILPLEDAIYNRGLTIRDINSAIYDIQENTIEVHEATKQSLEDQIITQEKLMEAELKTLVIGSFTKEMWEARKTEMELTTLNAELLKLKLGEVEQKYKDIAAAAADAAAQTGSATPAPDAPSSGGSLATDSSTGKQMYFDPGTMSVAWRNSGGMIPKYSTGSVVGAGGGDKVPAMVSPGEFVVRKAMVDKYGMPFFEAINQGSFSMPKYGSMSGSDGAAISGTKADTTIAPVYNSYSVTVNAPQANASADDIANTVINKIRSIDSMAVRRINGY